MKKILVFAAVTTLVIGFMFVACKKEVNIVKANKQHKEFTTEDLKNFEYYCPEDVDANNGLLLFNGYVNNIFNPMPNMELQEAVWYMETFFNVGICEKQVQFVNDAYCETMSFEFTVSLVDDNLYMLDGSELQAHYNSFLEEIVESVLPNYAINFADVFVKNVENDMVTIGINILYGEKSDINYQKRRKCLGPTDILMYPYSPNPTSFSIGSFILAGTGSYNWLADSVIVEHVSYCPDTLMEKILNSNYIHVVSNIIDCGLTRTYFINGSNYWQFRCDGTGTVSGNCPCSLWTIHKHGIYSECSIQGTPILTKGEYMQHASKYRDTLYSYCCNNIPQDYSPFLAYCAYLYSFPVSNSVPLICWHMFGIRYICIDHGMAHLPCETYICYEQARAEGYLVSVM